MEVANVDGSPLKDHHLAAACIFLQSSLWFNNRVCPGLHSQDPALVDGDSALT